MHPVDRRRRSRREPDHALVSGAGAELTAKEKCVHAAEREPQRIVALRRAFGPRGSGAAGGGCSKQSTRVIAGAGAGRRRPG